MDTTQTGELVFYNGKYGFVRLLDESTIFFPEGQLDKASRQQLRLLDQVSFQVETVAQGPHQGKLRATSVRRQAAGEPGRYRRLVGQLQLHNERFGRVHSPQLLKPVVLHYNRLLDHTTKLHRDELVVFSPVVSSKNAGELFAFFAYPLSQEDDAAFLQEQLEASQLPGIQVRLDQVLAATRTVPVAERFAAELRQLGPVHSQENYRRLTELLEAYDSQGFRPGIAALQTAVSPVYQLLLWENQLVPDYVPATLYDYFLRASADRKRELVGRLAGEQRRALLEHWQKHLLLPGKITRLTNSLKTYLDVIFKNQETKNQVLYSQLYQLLDLTPADWQQAYQHGYIHQVPASPERLALPPRHSWLRRASAARVLLAGKGPELLAYYEAELLGADPVTEAGQLQLALAAKLLAEFFPDAADRLWNWYWPRFSALQQLILWLVEEGLDLPNSSGLYQGCWPQLAVFLRLRFYQRQPETHPTPDELLADVLGTFAAAYRGHELVGLVRPWPGLVTGGPYYILLDEVAQVQQRWLAQVPSPQAVAASAYAAIAPYEVEHIRLYLNRLVEEEAADFVGFRGPFSSLTREEKQELKSRFDSRDKPEVWQHLRQDIVPCEAVVEAEGQQCYTAFLENIYFGRGQMQLRLPGGEFTAPFTGDVQLADKASVGLNSLPVESNYNRIPLKVWVKEQEIVLVEGLANLFDLLLEEEIAFTFAKKLTKPDSSVSTEAAAYAEDWELRRQVLAYLAQASTATHLVAEPRNYQRRLDDDSSIDAHEKTALYLIPTEDGVGIVWENLDFSEDRSTYVFKARTKDLATQLAKLKQAIGTFAQWRSALSNTSSSIAQTDFRNQYGYLARIRKQRGRNQPFAAWQERLLELLQQPVAPLPSTEEWEQAWQAARSAPLPGQRSTTKRRRPTIIEEANLDRVNPDTLARQPAPACSSATSTEGENLLRVLQQFTRHFCADLPHD